MDGQYAVFGEKQLNPNPTGGNGSAIGYSFNRVGWITYFKNGFCFWQHTTFILENPQEQTRSYINIHLHIHCAYVQGLCYKYFYYKWLKVEGTRFLIYKEFILHTYTILCDDLNITHKDY